VILRPRGHLADHPEVVKRRAGLHLHPQFGSIMTTVLPLMTTNRAFMPPAKGGPGIVNQTDVGGCEGCANGCGGTLRLAIKGVSKGLISNTALYLGALMFDQTLNPDGTLSTVTDTGTQPSSILSGWQTFGARLATNDPQYPMNSSTLYKTPGDPNSPLILPTVDGGLYADSPYRLNGAYFITATGPARLLQLMTTLASGRPVSDAIPASGQQFQGYTGGILGALDGPIDHANYIVDYEWTGSAQDWVSFVVAIQQNDATTTAKLAVSLILHCVNSWGDNTGWGEADAVSTMIGGMYRANIDYFNQAEDLCVLDLSAAA
jgi:hypothetical protein